MINHFYSGDRTPDSEIVQGFLYEIRNGFITSVETNNKEAKSELISFVFDRMRESMSHNDITVLFQFTLFPALTYRHFNQNFAERKSLAKTYSDYYHSMIEYFLKFKFEREDKKTVIPLYNNLYHGYISFLHLVLDNLNEEEIKLVANKFNDIHDYGNSNYYNKRFELLSKVQGGLTESELVDYIEAFRENDYPIKIRRVSALSLKSWFYYLYYINRINKADLQKIDSEINLRYSFFEEAVDDLLFLFDHKYAGFLGLSEWDIVEREDGKVYSPPDANQWLTLGFIISIIKIGEPFVEINLLPRYRNFAFIDGDISHHINSIKANYEKWQDILNLSAEKFTERGDAVINVFKQLKRRHYAAIELEVQQQPLDNEYVSPFKRSLAKAYIDNFTFYHLSSKFGTLEVKESQEGLSPNKFTQFLLYSKMMFVKNHHQDIFFTDSIGGDYARWLNRKIINEIRASKNEAIPSYSNIATAFNEGLDKLVANNFVASVIFCPSKLSHGNDLSSISESFKPSWSYKDANTLTNEIGRYKEIPVIRLFNSGIGNTLLICDFFHAFKLKLNETQEKFPGGFSTNVRLLSGEEIEQRLAEGKKDYHVDEYGNQISTEEAKIRLSTTVGVEMETFFKFRVVNPNAIFIATISEQQVLNI